MNVVMAGLVAAIYALPFAKLQEDVDARHKAGHDEWENLKPRRLEIDRL